MIELEDLKEGFYLVDTCKRSPLIQLGYVFEKNVGWVVHIPGGGLESEVFKQIIGTRHTELNPAFLTGPIDPDVYLEKHNAILKSFVNNPTA